MWYDALLDELRSLTGLVTVTFLFVIAVGMVWDAIVHVLSLPQRRQKAYLETMRLILTDDEHE